MWWDDPHDLEGRRGVHELAGPKQLHGIVGVSDVASQAFKFGLADALYVLALLSLSLAIINCFRSCHSTAATSSGRSPRRSAGSTIPFAVMERASVIGIALVLVLAAIGLSNDLTSL